MPFIPDQPTPGFVPDAPSSEASPQGPFKYLSATGQPTASPTAYDPKADPFASQGAFSTLKRNLPTSPAIPMAGILTGGALAPAMGTPALIGQMAGAGAAGAIQNPERPLLGAAFDAALTGAAGVAGSALGKYFGKAAGGFERAKEALTKAADAIRDKVPQGAKVFEVPSLSKSPMTFDEAVTALGKAREKTFIAAKDEFVKELNRFDLKGLEQKFLGTGGERVSAAAGETFAAHAPEKIWDPSQFSQIARQIASTPEGRLLLGIGGIGAAGLAGDQGLRWLLKKLPIP